jgi:hypothetical protein
MFFRVSPILITGFLGGMGVGVFRSAFMKGEYADGTGSVADRAEGLFVAVRFRSVWAGWIIFAYVSSLLLYLLLLIKTEIIRADIATNVIPEVRKNIFTVDGEMWFLFSLFVMKKWGV